MKAHLVTGASLKVASQISEIACAHRQAHTHTHTGTVIDSLGWSLLLQSSEGSKPHFSVVKIHISLNLLFFYSKAYLPLWVATLQTVNLKEKRVTWLNFSYIWAATALNSVVRWEAGRKVGIWASSSCLLSHPCGFCVTAEVTGKDVGVPSAGGSSRSSEPGPSAPGQRWRFKFQEVVRQHGRGARCESLGIQSRIKTWLYSWAVV